MFLPRLGHYHSPSTPFTPSITHTNWYVYVLQSLYQVPQQNGHSPPSEHWKHSPDQQWTQAASRT